MSRPAGLIRAGFPYLKTIGNFTKTSHPYDVALGQEGRIYVLCGGGSGPVSILNLDDEDLGAFGSPDYGFRFPNYKSPYGNDGWPVRDGALLRPCQIIVDTEELIYISDEGTDRISIFNRCGEFLGKWGKRGSKDGELHRPSGIAFDKEENIYVVDTLNHRVQKFSKAGVFLGKWGQFGSDPGEFNMPWGITIDELGRIYIADWRNDRIQVFDPNMRFLFKFGSSGSCVGEFNRPSGLAVDKQGDIYVADTQNNRVQLFTEEGLYVQQFKGDATLSQSFLKPRITPRETYKIRPESGNIGLLQVLVRPRSVRVDDQLNLIIADYESHRIQIYQKNAYEISEDHVALPRRAPTLNPGFKLNPDPSVQYFG